ncbi:hypothetical protein LCGC14_0624230, partial [marine sediment metagenome]
AKAGGSPPFVYPCPGVIMGETAAVRETLKALLARQARDGKRKSEDLRLWKDDMTYWQLCMQEGSIDPAIDYECEMAMVFGKCYKGMYEVEGREVICTATGRRPHMLHFNRLRRVIVKERMRELGTAVGYRIPKAPK